MNRLSRPAATVLYGFVAVVFAVLLSLVIWMAPLEIAQMRRNQSIYNNRYNPLCNSELDCVSFALDNCPAPHFLVDCLPKYQSNKEWVCTCVANGGLVVSRELEYELLHLDAGVDASP
jgi:hypothetical protein